MEAQTGKKLTSGPTGTAALLTTDAMNLPKALGCTQVPEAAGRAGLPRSPPSHGSRSDGSLPLRGCNEQPGSLGGYRPARIATPL
jgi:hypothetical protein